MGKGKKEVVLETELKRGLEEHSAKTSTSWASEGEGVGGAEARERGMREAEEECSTAVVSLSKSSGGGGEYTAGLERLESSPTCT